MKNKNLREKSSMNYKKYKHKDMPTQIYHHQVLEKKNPDTNQNKNKSSIQENNDMINN